jgi:hypothetical protein
MTRISNELIIERLREHLTTDDITFNLTKIHNKTGISISTLSDAFRKMRNEKKIHFYVEIEVPSSKWIEIGNPKFNTGDKRKK